MGNGTETAELISEEEKIIPKTKPKRSLIAPDSGSFDAVIIGGGPAGITSGVYLARKMVRTLLISPDLGGQVLWTSNVENWPGYSSISGWELAMSMREQLEQQEIYLCFDDKVVALEFSKKGGVIRTEKGSEYSFKGVVIATGKRSRTLSVPGEKELYGRGVTYCSTCDAPLYRGENVAVIGGGNSALTAANDLLALGCTVAVVNYLPDLQADPVLIEKAKNYGRVTFHTGCQVDEIIGDGTVKGLKIHDRSTGAPQILDVSGVFVEIGLMPNSAFAEGLVTMNQRKEILVNCRCETNVPGIYAAGDVTNVPNKQIIIAAGEGAKAALALYDYLLQT